MNARLQKADGWQVAPAPSKEQERLADLARYHILDTQPTPSFDRITEMVVRQIGVKYALVSLVDENRQWFKSACGLDAKETSRDEAFCAHAILGDELLVIMDASKDERFRGNPLVAGPPHIRFYAGAPLMSLKGFRLGTLCAIDDVPRTEISDHERFTLETLAAIVIDEMELHRANIELEQQIQAKSNFLAVMSHEIRTPMNGIVGMASLLQAEELTNKQRRCLGVISQSADAMMELMNDILDLSKIEAGNLVLKTEPLNLISVFLDTLDVMAPSAKEKGLQLIFELDENMPAFALGDAARIRQILINLISNAIKFTDEGKIVVRLESERRSDLLDICFSVTDAGIGIDRDDQGRIFDSFDQADMSSTRRFGGTGLGLAICRLLCRRMGGNIHVNSESGKGSVFSVSMPILADTNKLNTPSPKLKSAMEGLYMITNIR